MGVPKAIGYLQPSCYRRLFWDFRGISKLQKGPKSSKGLIIFNQLNPINGIYNIFKTHHLHLHSIPERRTFRFESISNFENIVSKSLSNLGVSS